jgi:hypothetical protein
MITKQQAHIANKTLWEKPIANFAFTAIVVSDTISRKPKYACALKAIK